MQYKYNFQVGEFYDSEYLETHSSETADVPELYPGASGGCTENISATTIAEALQLNDVQVRKDLASVSSSGKPKVGYNVKDLIAELEAFLGYNDIDNAVIVGAGSLGKALLNYSGFKAYGLNIIAAFDLCEEPTEFQGKTVFPIAQLGSFCRKVNVHIGIITVPASSAQEICDLLVESGIRAIWNFAPVHLVVPDGILVQNENMASSLALLSNHLREQMKSKYKQSIGCRIKTTADFLYQYAEI